MAPKFQNNPGSFNFSVAPTDIGSGYAAGITQAGKSIAGAISGIMGGIDASGNVQQGVLGQNQTANDMLTHLQTMKNPDGTPILSQDAYESLMGKSLGAKQQAIGMYMGQFQNNMELQRQIALAQAKEAASLPSQLAQIQATGAEQRKTAAVQHPEMNLAPKVVNTAPANVDADVQKRVQQQIEENRKKILSGGAFSMPPTY